jgi:membrane protein DedA with SNARE-associated domain
VFGLDGLAAELWRPGGPVVFLSVLLQQFGVPIPAEPTLIIAGSAVARHPMSLPAILGAVLVAVLIADSIWFVLGRLYGRRVLTKIYRRSRAPERWMRRAEDIFQRRGLKSVAVIKFVPGLPMLAPLFAGTMKARYGAFLLYDLGATLLWASLAVGCGVVFYRRVDAVLATFARMGTPVLLALAIGIAGVLIWTSCRRRRSCERQMDP